MLLLACNRQHDGVARQMPPGTWVVEGTYPNGGSFKSTLRVAPSGDYQCQIVAFGSSNVARTFEMEGTFQIQNGVLIDTMTKYSNTNAQLPQISCARILRMNERELVVDYERVAGVNYPTNETVFRKIR